MSNNDALCNIHEAFLDQRKAERAQQSDSSSEDDDEVSHGEGSKAK